MKLPLAALATALALSACATPPSRIKPIANAAPCTTEDRARLAEISKVQSATATNDAIGVLLIGLPVGSIVGDHANAKARKQEIGLIKGRCG